MNDDDDDDDDDDDGNNNNMIAVTGAGCRERCCNVTIDDERVAATAPAFTGTI